MTAITETQSDTGRDLPATLWRIGGGLALVHVVLLFAGFSQEVSIVHGDSPAIVERVYGGANLTRVFAGGYVEAMSFLVLTASVVVVARLIGCRTEAGRLAAQTFLALGVVFAASTLAVGFAPGAAALYGVQHGADLHAVAMVNDIRNFGFPLQLAVQGGMAVALGVAALCEKVFVKWVGWVGVAVGTLGIVATPFAQDAMSMVWLVWWVGLGVLFLKGGPKTARS